MSRKNNEESNVDLQVDAELVVPPVVDVDAPTEPTEPAEPAETPKDEVPEFTKAQKDEIFEALDPMMQMAIKAAIGIFEEHNRNTGYLRNQGENDFVKLMSEIREQNPSNNEAIASINEQITNLLEQVEQLVADANQIIKVDGLMPKVPSPEELKAIKDNHSASLKRCKDQINGFEMFENLTPALKGKLTILLPPIAQLRNSSGASGNASASASDGETTRRFRFSEIRVNGDVSDARGNNVFIMKDGKPSYTFTETAKYLKKQYSGVKVTAKVLTDAYLATFEGNDQPATVDFTIQHKFTTQGGNEETVDIQITATA